MKWGKAGFHVCLLTYLPNSILSLHRPINHTKLLPFPGQVRFLSTVPSFHRYCYCALKIYSSQVNILRLLWNLFSCKLSLSFLVRVSPGAPFWVDKKCCAYDSIYHKTEPQPVPMCLQHISSTQSSDCSLPLTDNNLLLVSETESHCTVQCGSKHVILLPLPPQHCHRHELTA